MTPLDNRSTEHVVWSQCGTNAGGNETLTVWCAACDREETYPLGHRPEERASSIRWRVEAFRHDEMP